MLRKLGRELLPVLSLLLFHADELSTEPLLIEPACLVDGTKGLICGHTVSDQALIINEGEFSYEGFAGQVAVTLDVTHYPLACVNAPFPKPEVGSHRCSAIK